MSQSELRVIPMVQTIPEDAMVINKCFPCEEAHGKQK